jgi:two-component system, chemotaxis family, chemotaxis protein CheY
MSKTYNGTAVPRHFVFVTANGSVVVQLSDNRGQDLYTGQYVELSGNAPGGPAADAELERLKVAGRVEAYNSSYVWVTGLPERHQYDSHVSEAESSGKRRRVYYLDTTFPAFEQQNFDQLLLDNDLQGHYTTDIRNDRVIIRRTEALYFEQFDDAAAAQDYLQGLFPDIFGSATVGFTTVDPRESQLVHEIAQPKGTSELAAIIASQTDISATAGKKITLLVNVDEDRILIGRLCAEMGTEVQVAFSGAETLGLLEDGETDLLIMDLQLPDMHGWEMLSKLREVDKLRHLPVMVIAEPSVPADQSLSIAVAQVDAFLIKPLSKARIRQNVWMALKNRSDT